MKLSLAFILVGIVLVSYSMTLDPYTNGDLFNQRYMELADTTRDSEAFWQLREEMLTPKYKLQDYGATSIALGALLFLLAFFKFQSPRQKWSVIAIGVGLPFLTVAGYILDLFFGMSRDEFPLWADSLAIPLMGAPVLFIILLVWSIAHLLFLESGYSGSTSLKYALSRHANWWLLFVSSVTLLLTVLLVAEGGYLYAVPGCGWLYFYLSLAAGNRAANATQQIAQPDASSAGAG
jgi:hypothetical protein